MEPPNLRISDDMSSNERRDYLWHNDHPRQEPIPLRDHSANMRTLRRPLISKESISEDEIRWDQKDGKLAWAGKKGVAGELRKHTLGLWLMILYGIVAILSWGITCVLCYQPIGIPTYFDQVGNYSRLQYERSDGWRKAAGLCRSIVAAVGIPVTSAICAKAAAVYCQRRSDAKGPPLSLRQMLALADKGWSGFAVLWDVLRPSTSRRTRSPLLMLSAVLVGMAFLIPVLQGVLVSTVHIKVLSVQDLGTSAVIGQSISPGMLVGSPNNSVMDNIISTTINGKLNDKQPYLWSTGQNGLNITSVGATIHDSSSFDILPKELFTATFPIGTDVGVLRNLALRLNVSVSCARVAQADFPSSCAGAKPLNRTFSNIINDSDSTPFGDFDKPRYRARVCAPGDIQMSPWQDISDRQDVYEEFWLDFQRTGQPPDQPLVSPDVWVVADGGSNFTQHCYGNSTLGYFELPNYWNGHVAGGLLDKVPPNGGNLSYHNSYSFQLSGPSPARRVSPGLAGPFLTAIVAVFGPNTFFDTVASNSNYIDAKGLLCAQLRYPFTGLSHLNSYGVGLDRASWNQSYPFLACTSEDPSDVPVPPMLLALLNWLPNFGDATKATAALTLATYAASNAILNVGPGTQPFFISACAGSDLQKPTMPLAAMVVITLLLAAQLVGLAFLAIYASQRPSWTESLDAWAMLRIGAEIGRDVPAVSALKAQRVGMLDEREGWVGDAGVERREGVVECRELVLGGRRRVRAGAMYRMVRSTDVGENGGEDGEIGGA